VQIEHKKSDDGHQVNDDENDQQPENKPVFGKEVHGIGIKDY
jgi:hypothetical protein